MIRRSISRIMGMFYRQLSRGNHPKSSFLTSKLTKAISELILRPNSSPKGRIRMLGKIWRGVYSTSPVTSTRTPLQCPTWPRASKRLAWLPNPLIRSQHSMISRERRPSRTQRRSSTPCRLWCPTPLLRHNLHRFLRECCKDRNYMCRRSWRRILWMICPTRTSPDLNGCRRSPSSRCTLLSSIRPRTHLICSQNQSSIITSEPPTTTHSQATWRRRRSSSSKMDMSVQI